MSRTRTFFRRLRTLLWTALTLVILVAAVLVGIGKLLMPYSERYQPRLEAWLSREFQQPVRVDSFTGEWKAFGPRISLEGVTLLGDGKGEGEIAIQHAALDIKPLNAVIPGRPLYTFRIIGADLSLVRTPEGRFELSGLGVSGRGGGGSENQGLRNLASVGEVRLEDSSLSFDDDQRGIHVQLTQVNGKLQLNGSRLATEVQASISDARRIRVLGDLSATLQITLDREQRLADAKWHVKTGELMISEFGKQLPPHELIPQSGWLNAEGWGSWSPDSPQVMEGVLDIREVRLEAKEEILQLDHLNARFRWRFQDKRVWRADLSDVNVEEGGKQWQTSQITVERNLPGGLGVWVSSSYLDVEFPMQLSQRIMSSFNVRWPKLLPRAGRGEVRDFDLVINSEKKLSSVNGQFDHLEVFEWGQWPLIAGINGSVSLRHGEGDIQVSGTGVRIDWPRNFRRQAIVDIPRCKLEIVWGQAWLVDVRECKVSNDSISVSGRSRFAGNEGKPAVDINLVIDRARLDALDDYWPESFMKPKVISWLRRGLVAGNVSGARFVLQGDMDDWPFRGGEGTLEARLNVEAAIIDYHPGWPWAENVSAVAVFEGTGMQATGAIGSLAGAEVAQVEARIEDFKSPELVVAYTTRESLPDMVEFIRQSPLLENTKLDLGRFSFTGEAQTHGQLKVPLKAGQGQLQVSGTLTLAGNGFNDVSSGVELNEISGDIHYDREGFRGSALAATFKDSPSSLSLAADWDAKEVFRADLSGRYPVAEILEASGLQDDPLLAQIVGTSEWDIELSVSAGGQGRENEIWLALDSGLEGVTIALPRPLNKAAAETWPLEVKYPVQSSQPLIVVDLKHRMVMQVETGDKSNKPLRASIELGGSSGELPPQGFYRVGGTTPVLDLDAWMDVITGQFRNDRYTGSLAFKDAMIHTDQMVFLNRAFPSVSLDMRYRDELLNAVFESTEIAGTVRYSRSDDGSHSLTAEMDRLLLPDPVDEGMTMDTNPADLPEMHLYAKQFRYLGLDLGETRIEGFPVANGFRIESLESQSPELNFHARGDWITDEKGGRSDFDIVMTSESLGSLVSAMDLSSVLEGGQTMIRYDAWWPGPPAAFALSRLNGAMNFSVIGGNIANADAGAGRVLGLLSISALPRRLALDFADVFGSGFNFDQANGTITLENGTAHTDDFVLESTAATLSVVGSSDLVAQEFDYTMTVRPGVSQALPVIGAIAAGPGGAAAGLALQGLLREALGDATEARYSISGPWSEPVVERLLIATVPGVQADTEANETSND